MQIAQQQFDALKEPQQERYVANAVDHLAKRFPEHAAALGPTGLRKAVLLGIDRAGSHGLTGGSDIYLYTCLMVAFGADFDRDAKLPWAGQILRSRILGDPPQRLQRVFQTALACSGQTGRPWVAPPA